MVFGLGLTARRSWVRFFRLGNIWQASVLACVFLTTATPMLFLKLSVDFHSPPNYVKLGRYIQQ